jgi:alpha-D-ribose 1-methylphosphonate 5-triphosphate synthase subunit PhnG
MTQATTLSVIELAQELTGYSHVEGEKKERAN